MEVLDLTQRAPTAATSLLCVGLAALTVPLMLLYLPRIRSDWSQLPIELAHLLQLAPIPIAEWTLAVLLGGTLLVIPFVAMIVHEGVHGLLFWAFTRSRPMFGWSGGYVHCSIPPGYFLSRDRHLVVIMGPLVLLTALGVWALTWIPLAFAPLLVTALVVNTCGSAGDLWLAYRLLFRPPAAYIWDAGAVMFVYRGKSPQES